MSDFGLSTLFAMASSTGLAELLAQDKNAFTALVREVADTTPKPGYMLLSEADRYFALVCNLFHGVDRNVVDASLAVWCIMHEVGGTQDFANKPDITAGNVSVKATSVFGGVIPTDNRGLARQFAATRYESVVASILDADPKLRAALSPRAAEAGLPPGEEAKVVTFMRGGQLGSRSDPVRAAVKHNSIARSSGVPRPVPVAEPVVREVTPRYPQQHGEVLY